MMITNTDLLKLILITLFIFQISPGKAQEAEVEKVRFGIGYGSHYDRILIHHVPYAALVFDRHSLRLGPHFTCLVKRYWEDVGQDRTDIYGVWFSYRYTWMERTRRLRPYADLRFAVFDVNFIEYQQAHPHTVHRTRTIVQKMFTFGGTYAINRDLYLNAGAGFGTLNGFFLILVGSCGPPTSGSNTGSDHPWIATSLSAM